MTIVATTGMPTWTSAIHDLDRFAPSAGRSRHGVDPWVDVLSDLVARDDVVVTCRADQADVVRRRLATVRSLLATERLALVEVPLGPLGAGVVVDVAAVALASGQLPAAAMEPALAGARDVVLDLAVVSSVSDLEVPGVGLRDQVRSYLPSKGFVVTLAPEVGVGRLAAKGTRYAGMPVALPGAPADLRAVTSAADLPPAVAETLAAVPETVVAQHPSLGSLLADAWHDDGAVEVVVVPRDPVTLLRAGLVVDIGTCTWCGRPATLDACLFCGGWRGSATA